MNKNIIVVGGDGFCGWPLSLRLSRKGYNVIILDNFSRRKIDKELGANSITAIKSLKVRISKWNEISKNKINFYKINVVLENNRLSKIIKKYKPKAVFMFAEYKSAPYSMMSNLHANKNLNCNIIGNNNLLYSIRKFSPKTHFIHLGTMGVYGYDYSKKIIPEGYYKAKIINQFDESQVTEILHPAKPGSIYHLSKAMDELLFQYYNTSFNLRITDLHQGIVWGCNTFETDLHPFLTNRFDYDHIYGTFLNRMVVQSVIKFPLTIHGTGEQKRPFINIKDAIKSYVKVLENRNKIKKVDIFNDIGEVKRLIDVANLLSKKYNIKISNIQNPRIEKEKNNLKVVPAKLEKLGLKFEKITLNGIEEIYQLAKKLKKRIKKKSIINTVDWKKY
jgi:UDP-sulfoquinovose synthase